MSDSGEDEGNLGMFEEPRDFYKPEPEATFAKHVMCSGQVLSLRLVGHNPLWGHLLWNAGRTVSDYLEEHASLYIKGKHVLELGAGAGLPSLVSSIIGAKSVLVTDYPDADLIENLEYNISQCSQLPESALIGAKGHLWGGPVEPLLQFLPTPDQQSGFQTLILADLLFNHSEHVKLVQTIQGTLRRGADAYALVFFTPYRPWLLQKDLAFFDVAREGGFHAEKIFEKLMEKVLFDEDPGDETLRRTVYGYRLQWAGFRDPSSA